MPEELRRAGLVGVRPVVQAHGRPWVPPRAHAAPCIPRVRCRVEVREVREEPRVLASLRVRVPASLPGPAFRRVLVEHPELRLRAGRLPACVRHDPANAAEASATRR